MRLRQFDRVFQRLAAEDVDTGQILLGFHEGPVREQRLAITDAHGRRGAGRRKRGAEHAHSARIDHLSPGFHLAPQLLLDVVGFGNPIVAGHQQVAQLLVAPVLGHFDRGRERPHLDREVPRDRVLSGDLDRLIEALGLDDVESTDELLGVGERAVGDQRLPFADAYCPGSLTALQAVAQQAYPAAIHLLDPSGRVLLHRRGDLRRRDSVCADQQ